MSFASTLADKSVRADRDNALASSAPSAGIRRGDLAARDLGPKKITRPLGVPRLRATDGRHRAAVGQDPQSLGRDWMNAQRSQPPRTQQASCPIRAENLKFIGDGAGQRRAEQLFTKRLP